MKKFGNGDAPFSAPNGDVTEGNPAELNRPTNQYFNNQYGESKKLVESSGQVLTTFVSDDIGQTAKAVAAYALKSHVFNASGTNDKTLTPVGAFLFPDSSLLDGAEICFVNNVTTTGAITVSVFGLSNVPIFDLTNVGVGEIVRIKYEQLANRFILAKTIDSAVSVLQPFAGAIERTQHDKNAEFISVKDFGAKGDGVTDDTLAIQRAIDAAGAGGTLYFETPLNYYKITSALKFLNHNWIGKNGVDVIGNAVEIRLVAASTSVAESKNPSSVCYGFTARGIYFNAQGFAPAALSLYNCSYSDIDACGANTTATDGAAILFDSDTGKQCYFNIAKNCRVFAANGVCFRFTRGANVNQIIGGKCGGSKRGAEFLSMSAGNFIVGTDFEDNSDCHIYCDATNNVFLGVHMENCPIGYNITANGWNNRRFGSTFASTVTTQVIDASKGAAVLDCYADGSGELKYNNFTSKASVLSTLLRVDNDLISLNGGEGVLFGYFRNLNTSSTNKRVVYYKGDGTATESFSINLATAEVQFGDLTQKSATGVQRKIIRSAAVPATGATGDLVLRTNTAPTLPVAAWTCINAAGTYAASSWIVQKSATRPTLTAIDVGVMHLDTNLAANGKPIWWTGSAWVDALGATV